jgi:hypothetical protein
MKFDVGETAKHAANCRHGLSCLETGTCGDRALCDVRYANGRPFLILKTTEHADCPYRVPFGGGQVCSCPVRFDIYAKYKQ